MRSAMGSDRRGQESENWDHWIRALMNTLRARKQDGGVRIEVPIEKEVFCGPYDFLFSVASGRASSE